MHITETGACYHLEGCGALRSDIITTLEEAYINGYQICDRCHPPEYTGNAKQITKKTKSESDYPKSNGTHERVNNSKTKTQEKQSVNVLFIIIISAIGLGIVISIVVNRVKAVKERKERIIREQEERERKRIQEQEELERKKIQEQKEKERQRLRKLAEQERQRHEYEMRKKNYEENYKGKSINEIVGAPEDVVIKKDGTIFKGEKTKEAPFGELTVYITRSGQRFHQNRNCGKSYGMRPINRFSAISRGYTACMYCGGNDYGIPEWYKKIPKVLREVKEFEEDTSMNE